MTEVNSESLSPHPSSFPRRRESRQGDDILDSRLRGNDNKLFSLYTFSVLTLRELLHATRERSRMMGMVAQPLIFWLIIGAGFVPSFRIEESKDLTYQAFFYPGVLAMVILFSAIFATITLIDDRNSGFLQTVLVGPGSRLSVVLGKVTGVSLLALIQAGLFLLIAPFAGIDLGLVNWIGLLVFMFLGAFSLAALGFVFAFITETTAAYHALMSMVLIPMWILSGAMFPLKGSWVMKFAIANPISWLVAGMRAEFNGGIAPAGTVPLWLNECVAFTMLLLFSVIVTSFAVVICKRKR